MRMSIRMQIERRRRKMRLRRRRGRMRKRRRICPRRDINGEEGVLVRSLDEQAKEELERVARNLLPLVDPLLILLLQLLQPPQLL